MRPGARESMYKKIILALEWIMDGTAYQISDQIRCKAEKVWKRVSELRRDDVIFDTGLRRPSPEGNDAMVYALSSRRSEYAHVKPPEKFLASEDKAHEFVAGLIQKAENHKKDKETIITNRVLEQRELFNDAD